MKRTETTVKKEYLAGGGAGISDAFRTKTTDTNLTTH